MAKRKANPNRKPVCRADCDVKQILLNATSGKVLQAWAVIFAAMAGFHTTTAADMLHLWDAVNAASTEVQSFDHAEVIVRELGERIGKPLPFHRIYITDVRTQGDLTRFIRKTEQNAVQAALAVIMEPIIRLRLLEDEMLETVLWKSVLMNEEIEAKEITVKDIQDMLLEEYRLVLDRAKGHADVSMLTDDCSIICEKIKKVGRAQSTATPIPFDAYV